MWLLAYMLCENDEMMENNSFHVNLIMLTNVCPWFMILLTQRLRHNDPCNILTRREPTKTLAVDAHPTRFAIRDNETFGVAKLTRLPKTETQWPVQYSHQTGANKDRHSLLMHTQRGSPSQRNIRCCQINPPSKDWDTMTRAIFSPDGSQQRQTLAVDAHPKRFAITKKHSVLPN